MNFSLYTFINGSEIDISEQSGNLAWTYQGQTLGVNLTFDFANVNTNIVEPGSIVFLKDEDDQEIIFIGIVVDRTKKGSVYSLSVYDFAWYLNKSEVIIQFNKTNASTAVKQLLKKVGVEAGDIPYMSTLITQIYIDAKPNEILNDIIEQVFLETDVSYFFEMNGSKLDIKEMGKEVFEGSFKLAANLSPIQIDDLIGDDFTVTDSISELKNSIIVVSSKSDFVRVFESVSDQPSINKYGLLQEVISIDDKDEAKSRNIAQNALKKLNNVMSSTSIPTLGHKGLRQYRVLKLNAPEIDLVGEYMILSAAHTYADGIYRASLSLEVLS